MPLLRSRRETIMNYVGWLTPLLLAAFGLSGCVVEESRVKEGLGSFKVELLSVDPFTKSAGCEGAPNQGSKDCPRPFAVADSPVGVRLKIQALDRKGAPLKWDGSALLDVRPAEFFNVGPGGKLVRFVDGVSDEVEAQIVHGFGQVRFWAEDCGSTTAPGSFATGVSAALYFESPRVDQLNETMDNTTSPLTPKASNACVITGDPRYGIGTDRDGKTAFVGYSNGNAVNAPPPAVGNFVELVGCTRAQYDEALAAGTQCNRGPLVVTGIGNEGFYLSDINVNSMATGFNHLYVFNFNYPENLELGDIVTRLRGSPVEFSGSTQMGNPVWERDGVGLGKDLIPAAVTVGKDLYSSSLRTFGRNESEALELEKLEGAVVCMDNIAPASRLVQCDVNSSGRIEREGCLLGSVDAPLPPLCSSGGSGLAPAPPACDSRSERPFCLDMSTIADNFVQLDDSELVGLNEEERQVEKETKALELCGLTGYLPSNPAEYCCERACYNDFSCSDESSLTVYGQWTGDINGRYTAQGETLPTKIAVITRDADPDFDPIRFAKEQLEKPQSERQTLRVVGNLRQVLAARPVWVLIARNKGDIEVNGVCP